MKIMKSCIAALCMVLSISVFGQATVYEKFQKINTLQQAQDSLPANPELNPALLNLSAGKDTTLIDKRLLRQKKGDVFSVGYVTYKIIESKDTVDYRASYIFLDG